MNPTPAFLVEAGLLAASGLIMALALRRRFPHGWWLAFGWPVLWWRMRSTWQDFTTSRDLTASRKPKSALLGGLVVKGEPLERIYPRLRTGLPTGGRVRVRVRMLPGQEPKNYEDVAVALKHAWDVHAVRVGEVRKKWIELLVLVWDPLDAAAGPGARAAARRQDIAPRVPAAVAAAMRVRVGTREDGEPWVIDFNGQPHWLIAGASLSGKSTLLNALVMGLAPHPVALVGIDLKWGMALGPYRPRLSALATSRAKAADLLEFLGDEMEARGQECDAAGAGSIWELGSECPVPVVVIVDEIAELCLSSDRAEQVQADRAVAALIRMAQLGAGLGVHLVVSGQRIGSHLGSGVTTLRSQLGGRVCHRVNDKDTAVMTMGDLFPDAVAAVQKISEHMRGVAVINGVPGDWMRARSTRSSTGEARDNAKQWSHMRQELTGLPDLGEDRRK